MRSDQLVLERQRSLRDPNPIEGYHSQVRLDVVPFVPRTGGTLVDLGGGEGATAAHLKSIGLVDRVGVVDRVGGPAHPDVDFQCTGDIEDETFLAGALHAQGPFDTVLALDILEHLVDPWRVVAQLHQTLVPGGHLIASIPNVRHFRVSGGLFFKNHWTLADAGILDRTHLRFFVKETAVELLTHSGLVLEEVAAPELERHRRERELFNKVTFGKLSSFVDTRYVIRVRRDDGAIRSAG
ncbi:MAG: class I SAM-dependent methyltransferase [Actinomycetota bacterium]|nr:class I SAM-dependent methyltransferase [Actinomycetota bacterium]